MNNKLEIFNELIYNYFIVIDSLINIGRDKNIIPLKYIVLIPILQSYIEQNKLSIVQKSLVTLLNNKDRILNFSLDKLDKDENINLEKIKTIIDKENINNAKEKESELFDLIIQIKNNSLRLDKEERMIIKSYIELMIIILEKIKNLFL
jgi:hypothetical protein